MNALWPGSLLPGGILEVSVECVAVPRCGHVSAWDASASCARWVNGFGLWGSGVRCGPCSLSFCVFSGLLPVAQVFLCFVDLSDFHGADRTSGSVRCLAFLRVTLVATI